MSIGYDPFRWADAFASEEEYLKELLEDEREKENELCNDIRERQTSCNSDAKCGAGG